MDIFPGRGGGPRSARFLDIFIFEVWFYVFSVYLVDLFDHEDRHVWKIQIMVKISCLSAIKDV